MEDINQFFHFSDVIKAIFALISGAILGYERELKDKSAGLKTISIISLGSALFAILSQNFSGEGDNFAIAAGIISGVGFLGAGVIFKEGFSIYGLTTAGIIWVSAAIGMAIGFGEFYIAGLFLAATMLIIYGTQFLGKHIIPNNNTKNLQFEIRKGSEDDRSTILNEIHQFTKYQNISGMEKLENENLKIMLDVHISNAQTAALEDYLLHKNEIITFTL